MKTSSKFRPVASLSTAELRDLVAEATSYSRNVLAWTPREKRAARELSRRENRKESR
jgi:hypothetical protein